MWFNIRGRLIYELVKVLITTQRLKCLGHVFVTNKLAKARLFHGLESYELVNILSPNRFPAIFKAQPLPLKISRWDFENFQNCKKYIRMSSRDFVGC